MLVLDTALTSRLITAIHLGQSIDKPYQWTALNADQRIILINADHQRPPA